MLSTILQLKRQNSTTYIYIVPLLLSLYSCRKDPQVKKIESSYSTNKLIVVVIDGPRYSETYGDSTYSNIPYQHLLQSEGSLCTSFYNMGTTNTVNGHTAICTGVYESIHNGGAETPSFPSFFQYYIQKYKINSDKAWIVCTKDKLEVLANTLMPGYINKYRPATNCGINGLGSGYRNDSTTQKVALHLLDSLQPNVMLINYKEPDASGHAANYPAYIEGIKTTDAYVYELWQFIQNNPAYKGKTTLIITNDHGRHNDGHLDGFVSHGDGCEGCRHISMLAIGPDIKKNHICTTRYSMIDITSTISRLFSLQMPYAQGKVMNDILIKP